VQYAGDSAGDTALMYAVQGDFVKALQLLLAAGADVRAVNESGQTALMKAARVDAGNEVKTHVVMLELLLKRGVDVNARDKKGKTALMHAAYEWFTEAGGVFSHPEILRVLLEHGADVNAQDSQGDTALMMAIRYCRITPAKAGNLEVVKILLEKEAQVNLQNREGQTAMTCAKELPVGGAAADQIRSSIIALLKKAEANE
jgi:ankyrin repeat protein